MLYPQKFHKGKSSFAATSDGMGAYISGGSDGIVLSNFHSLPDMLFKREKD